MKLQIELTLFSRSGSNQELKVTGNYKKKSVPLLKLGKMPENVEQIGVGFRLIVYHSCRRILIERNATLRTSEKGQVCTPRDFT